MYVNKTTVQKSKVKGKIHERPKHPFNVLKNFYEVFLACERDSSKVAGVDPTTLLNINSMAGISRSGFSAITVNTF